MIRLDQNQQSWSNWLFYGDLFIASQIPFYFTASNLMTKQKEKTYQGIWAIETFEYENTKNGRLQLRIPGTRVLFSDKVTPDLDDFTDEP